MSTEEQYDSALDLLRRLDPRNISDNLLAICKANNKIAEDLLSSVDQPLTVRRCPKTSKDFLCCDYNRDGDSYRSPWSGEFVPPVDDAEPLIGWLRKLEIAANDAVDTYRELYYEGGYSSVYFWEHDSGFAGAVLIQNTSGSSTWNSIHIVDVEDLDSSKAKYQITSTIILHLDSSLNHGNLGINGNLTRQSEKILPLAKQVDHVANIGELVEDMEFKLRNILNEVYFGKTRDIIGDIRSIENQEILREERKRENEVASDLVAAEEK